MQPLAASLRPKTLDQFVGQEHLVGPAKPLNLAIKEKHLFSFLLWGPPGVGKTTLAKIYAETFDADFYELSAVSAGKDDIRKIVEDRNLLTKRKIIFLDEIHRFNKAQQDFLLPYVESGEITLIGATTENPSFEVIPALLSRARVFVLKSLSEEEIKKIIQRSGVVLDQDAVDWLTSFSSGDARKALTLLDTTLRLYGNVTVENFKNAVQKNFLRYDKKGEEHYDTVSAFIKSMRASQPDAALYYLARMIEGGEDPKFIARRMFIFASEDIGLSDSQALFVAEAAFKSAEVIGLPECAINLAHATAYLAQAPKEKRAYEAYFRAVDDVKKTGNLLIPLIARNAVTNLMKDLGYGKNYERYTQEELLPEKLKGKKYLL